MTISMHNSTSQITAASEFVNSVFSNNATVPITTTFLLSTWMIFGLRASLGQACSQIKWAPCLIPIRRRLQTLAVMAVFPVLAGMYCATAWFIIFFSCGVYVKLALVVYLVYCFKSRRPATTGYHYLYWLRKFIQRHPIHKVAYEYFGQGTSSVVKGFDGDIDPSKKYLFAYQ